MSNHRQQNISIVQQNISIVHSKRWQNRTATARLITVTPGLIFATIACEHTLVHELLLSSGALGQLLDLVFELTHSTSTV